MSPELTIIIVSFNTRELTLTCLSTLFANTYVDRFRVVVFDNASADGSAEAVAQHFPQVELIRSAQNIGFAAANNRVAQMARSEWLLLLNPDTEIFDRSIDKLLAFAKRNPQAGITGGRTVFPDGSLNIASCWMRITPWSMFCLATGLTALFRKSLLFNPEAIGGWQRNNIREVDIVVGCFLMIPRHLWIKLDGFRPKYFMYGEEADLCLRARKLGYRPAITPDAEIIHLVGASSPKIADKTVLSAKARMTLMSDHWHKSLLPFGRTMLWAWAALRLTAARGLKIIAPRRGDAAFEKWHSVWQSRGFWLSEY